MLVLSFDTIPLNTSTCDNDSEASYSTKINKHKFCVLSFSFLFFFFVKYSNGSIKIKQYFHRGEDCLTKFCYLMKFP